LGDFRVIFGGFWCFLVLKMPILRTNFCREVILVQKNTLFDTELPVGESPGAEKCPFCHQVLPGMIFGAEKYSF